MFGGEVIDRISSFVSTNFQRRKLKEVQKIHEVSSEFQNFFEISIERSINCDYTVSGAKILDILDCMEDTEMEGLRKIYFEKYDPEDGSLLLFYRI
jgi:hypothetical protein